MHCWCLAFPPHFRANSATGEGRICSSRRWSFNPFASNSFAVRSFICVRPYVTAYVVLVRLRARPSSCSLVHLGCLAPAVIACLLGSPRPSVAVRGAGSHVFALTASHWVRPFRPPVSCVLNSCLVLIRRSPRDARSLLFVLGGFARPRPPGRLCSFRRPCHCSEDPRVSGQPRRSRTHLRYLSIIHIRMKTQDRFFAHIRLFSEDHGTFDQPNYNTFQPSHPFEDQKRLPVYHVDYLRRQAGPQNSRSTVSLCSSSRPTGKVHILRSIPGIFHHRQLLSVDQARHPLHDL
jgi:hypothetical protein